MIDVEWDTWLVAGADNLIHNMNGRISETSS
jgi:hypothetical protein